MVPVAELAARLPDIPTVQAWSQSLAMLEAILTPDPAFRCFTFDVGIESVGVARWCDGCGDEYWITFTQDGPSRRSCRSQGIRARMESPDSYA